MIFTIGHSTHAGEEFVGLLRAHNVQQLGDVRSVPLSRRHPHFNKETLDGFLNLHGIAYRHFPALGGRRRSKSDSTNTAWREDGFRGYADYMETLAFQGAVESLIQFSDVALTAVMCAESLWWRCHRRLLSDALVARRVRVFHILSSAAPKPHELSEFARVQGGVVSYPGLL